MIVVDAKLSEGTQLSSGQTLAKNHVGSEQGLYYKQVENIKKDELEIDLPLEIEQESEIKILGFYKMYGDGDSIFIGVKKL